MRIFKYLAVLLLIGCAPLPPANPVQPGVRITLPSGEPGYSVRCDNENMNACYERAGAVCPYGYDIQHQNKEAGFAMEGGAFVNDIAGVSSARSASTSEKGLIIRCKESDRVERESADRMQRQAILHQENQEKLRRDADKQSVATARFAAGFFVLLAVMVSLAAFSTN